MKASTISKSNILFFLSLERSQLESLAGSRKLHCPDERLGRRAGLGISAPGELTCIVRTKFSPGHANPCHSPAPCRAEAFAEQVLSRSAQPDAWHAGGKLLGGDRPGHHRRLVPHSRRGGILADRAAGRAWIPQSGIGTAADRASAGKCSITGMAVLPSTAGRFLCTAGVR